MSQINNSKIKSNKRVFTDHTDILIVEDDPIGMEALVNHLTSDNFNIKQCRSGYEAIEYLKYNKPILIILDVVMPGISGHEVCKRIREKHSLLDLPIIFITGMDSANDLAQGFSMGCNDYLMKPFSKHELIARVKNQITISISRKRLMNLKDFSSEIWNLKKIDNIATKLFNYIIEDPKISHAALFYNKAVIKNTFPQKSNVIDIYEKWKKGRKKFRIGETLIISDATEKNDFSIVLKSDMDIDRTDKKYFKNLIDQAKIISENFQRLIGDRCFLEDLSIILSHQKYIRFIKAENKQTVLYEDKNDTVVYLKSSLKTLEYVFSNTLIRINRCVLVNPDKIMWVDQKYNEKKKITTYIANIDGEEFNISKNNLHCLPEKIKKTIL